MGEKVSRNAEGYPDPTFGGAWGNMRREEKQREAERMAKINDLIPVMKQTAELAGFEVVGRITLPFWQGLEHVINDYLEKHTLEDMISQKTHSCEN